ncbi:MAG: serine protease [Candidatus Poribacteria bacterium]|nr:serine protease [Candidatus Poribacteria bacterium]
MKTQIFIFILITAFCGCGDEGVETTVGDEVDIPLLVKHDKFALSSSDPIYVLPDDVQFSLIAEAGIKSTIVVWFWKNKTQWRFGGTGFVIDTHLFVTAHHVIKDFDIDEIIILQSILDRNTLMVATVFRTDIPHDIAILRSVDNIDSPSLKLGSNKDVFIGQQCYTVSNPGGFVGTFSEGVVTGIRGNWTRIQFSASVSPGSSGAALLDEHARVIGVVTGIERNVNSIFTATPVGYLQDLLQK